MKIRIIAIFAAVFIFLCSCAQAAGDAETDVGATFSQVQCEYLDMPWKDTYLKTLAVGFNIVRLGAYWNRIEEEQALYNFSELDWQIRRAKEKKIKVLLTVGMKAPRWPEYFIPQWLLPDIKARPGSLVTGYKPLKAHLLAFIKEVVTRYKNEENIVAWQVENEPFDRAGPMKWRISKEFLAEEIELVRQIDDKKRPVVVNALTYSNRFLRFLSRFTYVKDPVLEAIDSADIAALNIYSTIGQKVWGAGLCFRSRPEQRVRDFNNIVVHAKLKNKRLWVTELQAEPWEPGELVFTGEKSITCWPESFAELFNELRVLDADAVFFWGCEYWFYRVKKYNDKAWLDKVSEIIASYKRK